MQKREYPYTKELTEILIPHNGIVLFSYNNERISIEANGKSIDAYILGSGLLPTSMPKFHKNYLIGTEKKIIIDDLKNYCINKNINKK